MKNPIPVIKKYTFTQEERQALLDIEIGVTSFRAAVNGMMTNKNVILNGAYKRIDMADAPEGVTRNISYNISKNEIIVTDIHDGDKKPDFTLAKE